MKKGFYEEKTVSLDEALTAFECQRNAYPEGDAWGAADPDYVKKAIEKLVDGELRISLTQLSSLLLRLHTGRAPGDVNKALQGIIMDASRQWQEAERTTVT